MLNKEQLEQMITEATVYSYIEEGKRFEANAAASILQPITPSHIKKSL